MLYRGMDRAQLNNSAAVTNYNAIKADWRARPAEPARPSRPRIWRHAAPASRSVSRRQPARAGWGHEEYLLPACNFPLGILQISKSLAFYQGHHNEAIGWEEGRNIRFLFVWAEGRSERKAWYRPRVASVWPLEGHMAIHIRRREFIVALGGVATARAALTVSGPALGQDYPNRQITILVGIAAGGITDVTTRQYAALLSKNLDQNVIVENRPVAGGAVAAAAVQGAAPDGYTLLSAVGSQFCSVPAMGPAPYDPVNRFAPISLTFRLPTLLIVPMDSPANTVAELLAWGKTKPGGLLLGSPGPGTPGHLLGAKIALATNTPIQYVHYRGGAPIMADLITGRLDFSLATFNSARSNMDAKKLGRWRSTPRRGFTRCLTFRP
jgi:hypothetical protein